MYRILIFFYFIHITDFYPPETYATMKPWITFSILILTFSSYLQAQSVTDEYQAFLAEVREGIDPSLPYAILRSQENADQMLRVIQENLADTLPAVRRACYLALDVIQQSADNLRVKQAVLRAQFSGVEDESAEVQALTIENLSDIPGELFDSGQKSLLTSLLVQQSFPRKEVLIRLVGALDVTEAIPSLQQLALPGNPSKIRWASFMALSRLGNEDAIAYTMERVKSLNVNGDMVYSIVPAVIYTRQKLLYDYLVQLLYSDERNCEPADPDQSVPINCAYRILEMLAPEIENFPIATTDSGDLSTNNYKEALLLARNWFDGNPDYSIRAVWD